MYCPNCNREMRPISQRIWDEIDYDEPCYEIISHCCDFCKIVHNEIGHGYDKPEWELPDELTPTEKQLKTEYFIRNRLGPIFEQPITKQQYVKFISKYFEKAKNTKQKEDWFDEWYGHENFEEYF